jgi:hypothetical protein
MNSSKFKALLAAMMLAFTMSVAFSGCSSSEEDTSGGGGDSGSGCYEGDEGRCCDVDRVQPGCEDYQPDA